MRTETLGRIGLHMMRWALVASLGAVMAGIWVMSDPAQRRPGRLTSPRPASAPDPEGPAEQDEAQRHYEQLQSPETLAEGAHGLVRLGDRRVVPVLVAVCDRHDPTLVEQLSVDGAVAALNDLLDRRYTRPQWLDWWDRHRDAYAEVRFFHRYRIRRNDTLENISRRVYGDRRHWRALYRHNRARLRDPDHLPLGGTLIIPHPAPEPARAD